MEIHLSSNRHKAWEYLLFQNTRLICCLTDVDMGLQFCIWKFPTAIQTETCFR